MPTRIQSRSRARGVTLIEVTLAGALTALLALGLFEGVGVAARVAQENAEALAADAFAFDLAWKRFNEGYAALEAECGTTGGQTVRETVSSNAVPLLYSAAAPAESLTTIRRAKDRNGADDLTGLLISVDVEWGRAGRRRKLSDTHTATVFVSGLGKGGG